MKACLVSGIPTPPGRFSAALSWLVEEGRRAYPEVPLELIDLRMTSDTADEGVDGKAASEAVAANSRRVLDADAVLLATPVYRATYTGLLKTFLDELPIEALCNKPVGILSMGASRDHYLAMDAQLRPVLAWFGALTLPVCVYLRSDQFDEGRPNDEAKEHLINLYRTLIEVTRRVSDLEWPLRPLAAEAMQPKA